MTDVQEQALGTSPILADTDGDGDDDNMEVTVGGSSAALIANLPQISIEVAGEPSIQLNITEATTGAVLGSYSQSYARGQSSSYSRSDTTATSATIEASTRVYSEAEVSAGAGGIGGSAKTGTESSVSASATREESTSITQTSASESRAEFGMYQEQKNTTANSVDTGSLTTLLRIRNDGDVTFTLSQVEVIAKKRSRDGGTFQPVGTLRFEPDGGPQQIPLSQAIEKTVTTDTPSVPLLRDLMANPSGLQFTIANYVMTEVGGTGGQSFADLSDSVGSLTAQVVIDYGEILFDGEDSVEQYMVATNGGRTSPTDPVDGITMGQVMTDILAIPYSTSASPILDANNQPTGQQRQVISTVRTTASQSVRDGFWYVYSSSDSLDDPAVDFDDIVLKPSDRITLVYLADADEDGLFNREEYLLGTDINSANSDGDQLTDFEEVRDGWTVTVDNMIRRVNSDPLTADVDGDGLQDHEERAAGTDPNNGDTDGDGDPDNTDPQPTGANLLTFDLRFSGPTLRITGEGLITPATGDTLVDATVDWDDGSSSQVAANASGTSIDLRDLAHTYAGPGNYTIRVTASSQASADESRDYAVNFTPRFTGDIACCLNDDGFNESMDTRYVEDVDGDGRADILAFGPDGVSVALSNGTGFDSATLVTTEFATDMGFDKSSRKRLLAQVGGGPEPDIVMFDTDGVYVALNDGNGNFAPRTRWVENYGVDQGFLNFPLYPRMLGDLNNDGLDDIVGYDADGAVFGLNTGSGAFNTAEPGWDPLPVFAINAGAYDADNPRLLADINNDNRADLVAFANSVTVVRINGGGGDFSEEYQEGYMGVAPDAGTWRIDRHIRLAADIDNDGDDDLFGFANAETTAALSVNGAPGTSLTKLSDEFGYNDGWRIDNDPRMLADLNGDGFLDIVGFGPISTGVPGGVYYALNEGTGFFADRILWTAEFAAGLGNGYTVDENPRFTGDVNGDGFDDLVIFDDTEVVVMFSAETPIP